MSEHTITITEEQRQLVILALAQLEIERPGWSYVIGEVLDRIPRGRDLAACFRVTDDRGIAQDAIKDLDAVAGAGAVAGAVADAVADAVEEEVSR